MPWLHKCELQKSTETRYIWNKQKHHEGTHCLSQIHEIRMGMIFQQLGSQSFTAFKVSGSIKIKDPDAQYHCLQIQTGNCRNARDLFTQESRVLLCRTLEHTIHSVFDFLTKGWKGREKS